MKSLLSLSSRFWSHPHKSVLCLRISLRCCTFSFRLNVVFESSLSSSTWIPMECLLRYGVWLKRSGGIILHDISNGEETLASVSSWGKCTSDETLLLRSGLTGLMEPELLSVSRKSSKLSSSWSLTLLVTDALSLALLSCADAFLGSFEVPCLTLVGWFLTFCFATCGIFLVDTYEGWLLESLTGPGIA